MRPPSSTGRQQSTRYVKGGSWSDFYLQIQCDDSLSETPAETSPTPTLIGRHCASGASVVLLILSIAAAGQCAGLVGIIIIAGILLIIFVKDILKHLHGFLGLGILHTIDRDA